MRWFGRLLIVVLFLTAVVPDADAGWFSRRKKGPKKKPVKVKKAEPKFKVPVTAYDVVGNMNVAKDVVLLSVGMKIGDTFTEDKLRKDVDTVKKLGYFSSIETDLTPYQGGVKITYKVVENPIIAKLQIQGNQLIPTRRVKELLNIKVGSTLNLTQLQEGIKAVNKAYVEKGYAFCGILSNEQFSIDPRTQTLRVRILEPKLRKLTVSGNKKTKSYVVTREMWDLKKGRLLKTEDIKRSMRDIHNLGYFEDVKPPSPKFDVKHQAIDLNFEVKEQKTGTASFGGGYSSVNGFIGFVDVAESNFRGMGQTVRAKYMFGGEQSFLLSFVEPWFRGRPVSVGGSIYDTKIEREQYTQGLTINRFLEERQGFGLSSGWRLARDSRITASFADERITIDGNVANRGTIQAGLPADLGYDDTDHDGIVKYHEQSLGLNWTLDKRDNYQNAKRGYRISMGASATGGFLAGPNGFIKYVGDYRAYTPMKLFHGMTLAGRFRIGATQVTENNLRFIDRFFVGGTDSVRGYLDRQFSGADFLVANVELRKDFSKMIGAALFFDSGDAWNSDGQSMSLKSSYGIGLRINTPMGAFRLDYGFPLNLDADPRLHFGIGQSF